MSIDFIFLLALLFLVVGTTSMMVIFDRDTFDKKILWVYSIVIIFFLYGVFMSISFEKTAYQKALDYNPYEKVYQYEQIDGKYIIVDSTYIKKDTN